MKKKIVVDAGFILLMAVVVGLSLDLNPFSNITPGTDSSVFLTIGKGMAEGKLPYADFFDHKGPILYFINSIGWAISGFFGVFAIEFLMICVSLFFAIKTLDLFFNKISVYISVAIGYVCFGNFLMGGNLTEEFALPFITIAFYLFSKYIVSKQLVLKDIAFIGACFGATLMLRPNMFGLFVGFCAIIFFDFIINKHFDKAIKAAIMFLVGTAALLLIVASYLLINGIFDSWFEQFILFNFVYASDNFGMERLLLNINQLNETVPLLLILSASVVFLITEKTYKKQYLAMLLGTFATTALVLYSRAYYPHYSMSLVPFIIFYTACIIDFAIKTTSKDKAITIMLVCLVLIATYFQSFSLFYRDMINRNLTGPLETKHTLQDAAKYIEQNTDVDDTIISIGSKCEIYPYIDRSIGSKYLYQDPINRISSEIAAEFEQDIIENKPEIVMFSFYDPVAEYSSLDHPTHFILDVIQNHYELGYSNNGFLIYERID